ncbi:MAG: hypothetical protein ACHQ50_07925 [Fimbriimonadales bacterium]
MLASLTAYVLVASGQTATQFSWKDQTEYEFLIRDDPSRVRADLDKILLSKNGWETVSAKNGKTTYEHDSHKGAMDVVGFIDPKLVHRLDVVRFPVRCAVCITVTGKPTYLAGILATLKRHGVGWKVLDKDRAKFSGAAGSNVAPPP